MAFSEGKVDEYLIYADYLTRRGFKPRLVIVDVRRGDLIGEEKAAELPDFLHTGTAPPSIFATYLTLDALNFSIRTLRRDPPHHRYYDKDFGGHLEIRSKRRYYNPKTPIKPEPPPFDVRPERGKLYVELRRKFPTATAIAYLPPESAWRIAAFSLTSGFDPYLAVIGDIAAAYDKFLDFSFPSPLTKSKAPADTYDGSHYSRKANERVVAALFAEKSDLALDWRRADRATIAALYRQRLDQFIAETSQAKAEATR
jgi:hypothetical protein